MPVTWGDNLFGTNPATSLYKRPYDANGHILPSNQWWGYNRATQVTNQPNRFSTRWTNLKTVAAAVDAPGMAADDRILVVGAAYGYLIEAAIDDGYTAIWGLDNSSHVAANLATEGKPGATNLFTSNQDPEDGPPNVVIVAADVTGGPSVRQLLSAATGSFRFDWIITESVAESFAPGNEMDGLLGAAESILSQQAADDHIIHLVVDDPGGQPIPPDWSTNGLTWLTLAAWNAIRPAHSWVSLRTWQVA